MDEDIEMNLLDYVNNFLSLQLVKYFKYQYLINRDFNKFINFR